MAPGPEAPSEDGYGFSGIRRLYFAGGDALQRGLKPLARETAILLAT